MMPMPDSFKDHCRAVASKQPDEIAHRIRVAVDAEDHDALDDALQAAENAAGLRLEKLRDIRVLTNKLTGGI